MSNILNPAVRKKS